MRQARPCAEPSWKARVGRSSDRPDMQAPVCLPAAELRAGKAIYPPPQRILPPSTAPPFDKVKVVIRDGTSHGRGRRTACAFRAARRTDSALTGQHLQGDRARPRHPAPEPRLPAARARQGAAAQRRPHRGSADWRAAQGAGLGGLHGRLCCRPRPRARGPGVPALGQLRPGQGPADRSTPTPGIESTAPLTAVGPPRLPLGCGHFGTANRHLESRGQSPSNGTAGESTWESCWPRRDPRPRRSSGRCSGHLHRPFAGARAPFDRVLPRHWTGPPYFCTIEFS